MDGSVCLGGIFDQGQGMFLSQGPQRCYVRRLTKQVHSHDRDCFSRENCLFHSRRIYIECLRIDIDQGHSQTAIQRCIRARNEADIRDNDLAAIFQPIMIQGGGNSDPQRICPVWDQQRMLHSTIVRPLLAKLLR